MFKQIQDILDVVVKVVDTCSKNRFIVNRKITLQRIYV